MKNMNRLVALATITTLSVAAHASVYSTGFEAPEYTNSSQLTGSNGWTSFGDSGNVGVIESTTVKSGAQAVKLQRTGNDASNYGAMLTHDNFDTTPENATVKVEWDMFVLDGSIRSDFWGVGSFDGPFAERFSMGVSESNKLVVRNAFIGTVTTAVSVSRNAWNHYEMDLNYQTKKVDVVFNGSTIGQWNMLPGGTAHINTVLFNRATTIANDGAIYDNLTVSSAPVPEPATMAVLGVGLLGVLKRRKR